MKTHVGTKFRDHIIASLTDVEDRLGSDYNASVAAAQADALLDILTPVLIDAWDDGNATGLDGWEGAGIGAKGVDPEAEAALRRFMERLR